MQISISIPGMVTGAVFGAALRFGLSFSETYHPGWFWWFEHGLHVAPGTAGFAGFVAPDIVSSNYASASYCLVVSLLPGLFGGIIGATCGASGRPVAGALGGGLFSGIVLLLMRVPELYRPGWFGSLWLDNNVPIVVEGVIVGAIAGAVAGAVGRFSRRDYWPRKGAADRPPG